MLHVKPSDFNIRVSAKVLEEDKNLRKLIRKTPSTLYNRYVNVNSIVFVSHTKSEAKISSNFSAKFICTREK